MPLRFEAGSAGESPEVDQIGAQQAKIGCEVWVEAFQQFASAIVSLQPVLGFVDANDESLWKALRYVLGALAGAATGIKDDGATRNDRFELLECCEIVCLDWPLECVVPVPEYNPFKVLVYPGLIAGNLSRGLFHECDPFALPDARN